MARGIEYVIYHVNLGHTPGALAIAGPNFRLYVPPKAAQCIQLRLINSLEKFEKVVSDVVWHSPSPQHSENRVAQRNEYVTYHIHTYNQRTKLEAYGMTQGHSIRAKATSDEDGRPERTAWASRLVRSVRLCGGSLPLQLLASCPSP